MGKYTIQEVLEQHLNGVLQRHNLPWYQIKALKQLSVCRTKALGGHTQVCENGHLNGVWYNSCKNRSCPQCRGVASEQWLRNTQSMLLDCPHHHVVFTFASELNDLWRYNRERFTDILFQAVQQTLKQFSNDPRYLNATPGILSTLHTWGRAIPLHPHIHVVITHGGVDKAGNWVEPKKKALFPQKPVRMVYRGKLRDMLMKALEAGELTLPPDRRKHHILAMLNKIGRKESIVHFCKRYDHANGVAKYLARYVKGGPLRNSQIVHVSNDRLTFSYKSHKSKRVEKLNLSIDEFVLRFAQHIALPGKQSVRYSGIYSSSAREKLNKARESHGQDVVSKREHLAWQDFLEEKGDRPVCSKCGKSLVHRDIISRQKLAA